MSDLREGLPLPPEPPFGAVVLDRHNRAWQRVESGRGVWCCTEDDASGTWEELQQQGPLTRLMPALAEAITPTEEMP